MFIENFLEVFDLVVGVVAISLAIQLLSKVTLGLQKRAVISLLGAIVFFAFFELFEVVRVMGLLADVELLREFAETGFLLCLTTALYLLRQSESKEVDALRHRANIDSVTSLFNQAYFRRAAQRRFEKAKAYYIPTALIIIDIDSFKTYNDSFGHEAGNTVLSFIAHILRDSVRADDIVARYGGDEFIIMMTDKLEYARTVAERIRSSVETQGTPERNPQLSRNITVSLGVATLKDGVGSLEALIEAADKQLYRAKSDGRNCVRTEDAA